MPPLSARQFWKANPNQMSLPGMEEHGHAGSKLLAQGYHFRAEHSAEPDEPPDAELTAVHPSGQDASTLIWFADPHPAGRGEIGMVQTGLGQEHKGLATALYGMGRQMARIKPQHSPRRSPQGDRWAKGVSKKYGGRIPKLDQENPY